MKYRYLFVVLIFAIYSACLAVFPSGSSQGALDGIKMCYSVIIPSLFPFTVGVLIIFEYLNASNKLKNPFFVIMLFSFIGGYPVGSKLIENSYTEKRITRRDAELMLAFCVNSGPSFILMFVGSGILGSKVLGVVLLSSNILASFIIFLVLRRFMDGTLYKIKENKRQLYASDVFVKATYDATNSMIGICAFVVLFSSILGLIKETLPNGGLREGLVLSLEVTNSISLADRNIFVISFLLGFAGFSVHFQILSQCKNLKPNYFKFFLSRLLHGGLSAGITYIIIKLFDVSIPTVMPSVYSIEVSHNTMLFSFALIITSIIFMVSISKICKIE